ncbi:MAG: hypothetical protein AAFX41_07390 [Bacteroidota bacterium]
MRALVLAVLFSLASFSAAVAQERQYERNTVNPSGAELYAVFITQSVCHGSNRAGFDQTIARAKTMLAGQAADDGLAFAVRGVVLDWDPRAGVDYLLGRFGQFDEVASGRNWFGADAAAYIWEAEGGVPATPQLIVFRRTLTPTDTGIDYSPDELVARFVGVEIDAFVAGEVELPWQQDEP